MTDEMQGGAPIDGAPMDEKPVDDAEAGARAAADDAAAKAAASVKSLSDEMSAEQTQGFVGERPDPTPLENYTAQGQADGKPTPETNAELYAEAHLRTKLEGRFGV